MEGFREAMADGHRRSGISSDLILCFLRHLSGKEAVETLREAEDHLEGVIAVGLDSSELGRPPELFVDAFDAARALGLRAVAHAGEEGPPEYVVGALDVLGAERIDHGVRSLEDDLLMERLRMDQVPLTVCPLSNVELRVVRHISEHPLRDMIQAGLNVSVNSDDPAYFGGYIVSNYLALAETEHFNESVMADLAVNSINSSFLDGEDKASLLAEIEQARGIEAV
jgi:adenosine deaminase